MKFYDLTKPDYPSDYNDMSSNPIKRLRGVKLPAILCEECFKRVGGQWTSSYRIRVSSEKEEEVNSFLTTNNIGKVVQLDEWFELRKEVAGILKVDKNYIAPGAQIGLPKAQILSNNFKDIVHPFLDKFGLIRM